jgi:hypothetical protein
MKNDMRRARVGELWSYRGGPRGAGLHADWCEMVPVCLFGGDTHIRGAPSYLCTESIGGRLAVDTAQ